MADPKSFSDEENEPDLALRSYQVRLVELCREKNGIIWLGTGMGKTYVAVELIKGHLELAKTPLAEGGKRIVFLAPTVPLSRQQSCVINRFTGVATKKCCGVDGVDSWDKDEWHKVLEDSAVLVMTPAVLRDCLQKCYVTMGQLSLLIFDECHHAVGDGMYTQIMKYYDESSRHCPRLLAMTATLVNRKIEMPEFDKDFKVKMCAKIQKHLDNLCTTLKTTILTTEDPREYNSLGANPKIDFRNFSHYNFSEIVSEINKFEQKVETFLDCDPGSSAFKEFAKVLRSCKRAIVDLGPVGARNILREFRRGQRFKLENPTSSFDIDQTWTCVRECEGLEKFIENEQARICCDTSAKVQLLIDTLWEFSEHFSGKSRQKEENGEDLAAELNSLSDSSENQDDEFLEFWREIMQDEEEDESDDGLLSKKRRLESELISSKITAKIVQLSDSTPTPTIGAVSATPVPTALRLEEAELSRVSTNSRLCCVIFVEQRLICAALAQILDAASRDPESPLYNLVNVDYVIGQSGQSVGYGENRNGDALARLSSLSAKMTAKRQDAVLGKFRIGLLNVVVATNVLEEGLDVPQCNLIVMFDMPKTPKDYIQSKGRGRAKGAHYVVLMPEAERAEMERTFNYFRFTERLMMRKYFGFVENLDLNVFTNSKKRDALIPPFCPHGPNGQKIDRLRAVELLNQYIAKIGRAGSLEVKWDQVEVGRDEDYVYCNFKATVYLPFESGITDPISHENWLPSKRMANQAAALEACKRLYEKGAIRLDGIPTHEESAQSIVDKESIILGPEKGAGTKKRVQVVERPRPTFLDSRSEDTKISPGKEVFIYKFDLSFENSITTDTTRLLDMITRSESSFGLISPVKLPNLPKFRLYPRKHEVVSDLKEIGSVELSHQNFNDLQNFHRFLIEKIIFRLKTDEDPDFEFSPDGSGSIFPFLIVPLKSNSIDWKSVQLACDPNFNDALYPGTISPDQTCLPLEELIAKNLANSKSMIVLIEVSENETANSLKLGQEISHFQFLKKCGIKISDPDQKLVYGVPLTSHLSHFSRIQLKTTGNSATKNVGNWSVPETLRRLPISGSLTTLSRYLPSLIFRTNQLCLVKEFREKISPEIGLKIESSDEVDEICVGDKGLLSDFFALEKDENDSSLKLVERFQSEFASKRMKDAFDELPGELFEVSSKNLLDAILSHLRRNSIDSSCKPCTYFLNVHLPGLFRTYFLVKLVNEDLLSNDKPLRIAFKCRLCRKRGGLDFDPATPFDLLKHVVETHFRLLSSPYVVWPSFTDVNCQICRLVFKISEDVEENMEFLGQDDHQIRYCLAGKCPLGAICEARMKQRTVLAKPPEEICRRQGADLTRSPSFLSFFQALSSIRQRDICDNERFELLGDTFLKYAVTTYLFVKYQTFCQGQVTYVKGKLVSNANLRNWAAQWKCLNLMAYPFVTPFDPLKVWLPPCYRDKSSDLVRAGQKVPDKVVADTVEALIGLFLTTCGPTAALRFLHSFGIKFSDMPPETATDPAILSQSDFSGWVDLVKVETISNEEINAQWIHYRLEEIEAKLGYHFKHHHLLLQAFCHPSGASRQFQSYERLELLGDALIDYMVTASLFTKSAKFQPGILSTVRTAIVNNDVLGSLCVLNQFHAHINASPAVISSIGAFVNDFLAESHGQPDETRIKACPYRDCGKWAESIEVPKVLGDILESLAGAVFIDCGLNLETFWAVFYPLLEGLIERFAQTKPCNPLREMYERFAQVHVKFRYGDPPVSFRLPPMQNAATSGVIVSVYVGDMVQPAGTGRGANKKLARQAAANMVLANLGEQLPQLAWRL